MAVLYRHNVLHRTCLSGTGSDDKNGIADVAEFGCVDVEFKKELAGGGNIASGIYGDKIILLVESLKAKIVIVDHVVAYVIVYSDVAALVVIACSVCNCPTLVKGTIVNYKRAIILRFLLRASACFCIGKY